MGAPRQLGRGVPELEGGSGLTDREAGKDRGFPARRADPGRAELGGALVRPLCAWRPFCPYVALACLGSHRPKFRMDRMISTGHRLHMLRMEAETQRGDE